MDFLLTTSNLIHLCLSNSLLVVFAFSDIKFIVNSSVMQLCGLNLNGNGQVNTDQSKSSCFKRVLLPYELLNKGQYKKRFQSPLLTKWCFEVMQGHANTLNFNFEIVGFSLGKKLFITAQTELEVFYSSETSSPNARQFLIRHSNFWNNSRFKKQPVVQNHARK